MNKKSLYEGCNAEQIRLLDLAIREDNSGNIDVAKKLYHDILKINSSVPYVQAMLGGIEFDNKNYKEAIAYLDRAILLKPNSPGALELRGECKERLCRYKEAVEDYNLALEFKPSYAKALFNKGLIFHYEGDVCKKKEYYHIAYKCIKKARFYDNLRYDKYFSYFKRKIKYLKRIGLF